MFMNRAALFPIVSAFGFKVLTDPMAAVVLLLAQGRLPLRDLMHRMFELGQDARVLKAAAYQGICKEVLTHMQLALAVSLHLKPVTLSSAVKSCSRTSQAGSAAALYTFRQFCD